MFDVLRICMKLPIFYLRSTQTHRRCNAGLDSFSGGTKPVCVQPATSTSDYSGASNGRGAESYKILGDGAKVGGQIPKKHYSQAHGNTGFSWITIMTI